MNQYIISGNLTQDAELKTINGKIFLSCRVAVNETKDKTLFVEFLMQGDEEYLNKRKQYMTKGVKIIAYGRLSVSAYINKQGIAAPSVTIFVDNFEYLSFPKRDNEQVEQGNMQSQYPNAGGGALGAAADYYAQQQVQQQYYPQGQNNLPF